VDFTEKKSEGSKRLHAPGDAPLTQSTIGIPEYRLEALNPVAQRKREKCAHRRE